MELEREIMKAYRKYESSNYMDTKALNRYLKLTEWYDKYNRSLANQFDKEKAKQMIIEEMADVTIMMAQLIDIAGMKQSQIDEVIKFKILRMEERLNKLQEEDKK